MTTLNTDSKFIKCRSVPAAFGTQEDAEVIFYITMGATGNHKEALEGSFLALLGFTQGTLRDRWFTYLRSLGLTGTIHDMKNEWWKSTIAAPPGPEQPVNPSFTPDLTGWTLAGTTSVTSNVTGLTAPVVGNAAKLDTTGVVSTSSISQVLNVVPGAVYNVVMETIVDAAVLGTTTALVNIAGVTVPVADVNTPTLVASNAVKRVNSTVIAVGNTITITMSLLGAVVGSARAKFVSIRRII